MPSSSSSSSSSRDLPSEIVKFIIQQSEPSVIYQWMFVSKAWSVFAINEYYKDLELNTAMIKHITQLICHGKSCTNRKELYNGYLVNKLKLCENLKTSPDDSANPARFLSGLLSYLTTLTVIDISSSADSQYYLYDGLLRKIKENRLKHIQQIIVFPKKREVSLFLNEEDDPNSAEQDLNYFNVNYKFRNTITHLDLYDIEQEHYVDDAYRNYRYFLPHFKSLTHLSIFNHQLDLPFDIGHDLIMPFVFSVFPNLISFRLKNSFNVTVDKIFSCEHAPVKDIPEIINVIRQIESRETERINEAIANESPTRLPSTILPPQSTFKTNIMGSISPFYNIHLKNLELFLPTLEESQMNYIMSYIPFSQLDTFTLELTRVSVNEWIQSNNIETTMKFANHLSSVKHLNFSISSLSATLNNSETENTTNQQQKESKVTIFWKFVNAIKGSRNVHQYNAMFLLYDQYKPPVDAHLSFALTIENNHNMTLKHAIEYGEFFHNNKDGKLTSNYFLASNSMTGPTVLNYLELVSRVGDPVDLVEYALTNCPKLNNLEVHCCGVEYILSLVPTTRRRSSIQQDYCEKNVVLPIPIQQQHQQSNTTWLSEAIISDRLLHAISSSLPFLEELTVANCNDRYEPCSSPPPTLKIEKLFKRLLVKFYYSHMNCNRNNIYHFKAYNLERGGITFVRVADKKTKSEKKKTTSSSISQSQHSYAHNLICK